MAFTAPNSSFYAVLDECSTYSREIYDALDRCTTEGAPFIIEAGNPTVPTGPFHDHHTKDRYSHWNLRHISRIDVFGMENQWNQQKIAEHGWDSDWCRVSIRGLFPNHTENQLIGYISIDKACQLDIEPSDEDPLIWGLDVARGGDKSVLVQRRGRLVLPEVIELDQGSLMDLARSVAELMLQRNPDHVVIDEVGMGYGILDRLEELGFHNISGVNSTRSAPCDGFQNLRAYLYWRMKERIEQGQLKLPVHKELKEDLGSQVYFFNDRNNLQLEPKRKVKERLGRSCDYSDALALTFSVEGILAKGIDIPGHSTVIDYHNPLGD